MNLITESEERVREEVEEQSEWQDVRFDPSKVIRVKLPFRVTKREVELFDVDVKLPYDIEEETKEYDEGIFKFFVFKVTMSQLSESMLESEREFKMDQLVRNVIDDLKRREIHSNLLTPESVPAGRVVYSVDGILPSEHWEGVEIEGE